MQQRVDYTLTTIWGDRIVYVTPALVLNTKYAVPPFGGIDAGDTMTGFPSAVATSGVPLAADHGDANVNVAPASDSSWTVPTAPLVLTAADTTKAPYVRSAVNEAVSPSGHPGKKWTAPSTDRRRREFTASVAPTSSYLRGVA